ncbi:Multicopper oxidase type 2 (Modular protein) [Crenothrix polyspora]|uniref:Multicopper oxidase type 2 (Modular protein) n=1 Tax=Crenothrix polyspora TaxID=360316 RepID=A0A1R4GYN3_9GAMM|nr:multicopper oxidase domain-containing protein [Crenothrix polyspora]SJM89065.1 Multicopper oxidase type 2 (Modular protein) [Crenothrix polyspora]
MNINTLMAIAALLLGSVPSLSAMTMNHDGMYMDEKSMIMNANENNLPKDCPKISENVNLTIRAGHKHATKFNGKMFAFDQQEWNVKPCAKINITFINDDQIRHQLMIHGLPGYLYPHGMFHLELYGEGQLTASLIVPSMKKTYLVHCEIPQHMEKGMKAQLKVDGGDIDIPSIPGISAAIREDVYPVRWTNATWIILLTCIVVGCLVPFLVFWMTRKEQVE